MLLQNQIKSKIEMSFVFCLFHMEVCTMSYIIHKLPLIQASSQPSSL